MKQARLLIGILVFVIFSLLVLRFGPSDVSASSANQELPGGFNIYLPIVMKPAENIPTPSPDPIRAKNYVQTISSGGVTVEIERVLFGEKNYLENRWGIDYDVTPVMQDKIALVEFMFRITNSNNFPVQLFKDDFIAVFSSEQVNFSDYHWYPNDTWGGPDDFDHEIMPGATVADGVWVGLINTSWNGFNSISLKIPHFFNADTYYTVVPAKYISIDVTNWGFEPLP